jgi:predicted metalloprotease with PDZ domain
MTYSHRPGRKWRSLEDTATTAQILDGSPEAFRNYRRGVDYYEEGALLWLEADTIIRQNSGGKRSMDDFAHLFYGGRNTAPEVKTYTFDDVVNTLNQVQPYDWRGFLTNRVLKIAEHAPLEGIANGGWRLVYTDQANTIAKLREQQGHGHDLTASLGLVLTKKGVVADAIEDGIAAKNGIGPGMRIVAVNGRKYSQEFLSAALREAQKSHQPLQLLVENTEYFHTVSLNYFDGLRDPHLVRDTGRQDLLGDIIKPKVTAPPQAIQGVE